jgi:hypothetical protein
VSKDIIHHNDIPIDAAKGYGIMATADSLGKANTAVYRRPHGMDEKTVAFLMDERLTHENLKPQFISCF